MTQILRFKRGVDIRGLQPEMALGAVVAYTVLAKYGPVVITSVKDGAHKQNSLHYQGKAIDLRTWHMREDHKTEALSDLRDQLGPQFDVVLESDHLHVEFDPKE